MDYRERVLAALNLEEPDSVPTHTIYLDANNVDNILGKPVSTDFDLLEQTKNENPDDWPKKMSDLLESVETSIFSRCVEAAIKLGLDCMQIGIVPVYFIDELDDNRNLMKDIFGRVWEAKNNEGNFNGRRSKTCRTLLSGNCTRGYGLCCRAAAYRSQDR